MSLNANQALREIHKVNEENKENKEFERQQNAAMVNHFVCITCEK